MNYLDNNVERLQFEISNICNLNCIGCVRTSNDFNGSKERVGSPEYISKETFEKIISAPEFINVKYIEFCGSIDDPAAHPEFLELVKIIVRCGIQLNKKFTLQMHTNGSLRNTKFWKEFGSILMDNIKTLEHIIMFNIDGLEDTNHIYRQGSNWTKIMDNAQALIDTGVAVIWQYIIFPWNEHQVDEAYQLSVKKSFHAFYTRKDRSEEKTNLSLRPWAIENTRKISKEMMRLTVSRKNNQLIECPTRNDKMYFIDYKSRLWPCCFIPGAFILYDHLDEYLSERLFERYSDVTWNDCTKHSISDIINHRFYTEDLVDSWNSDTHETNNKDRLYVCSQSCSSSILKSNPMGNNNLKTIEEFKSNKKI